VGECTPPTGTSIIPYDEHNNNPSSHGSTLAGTTTIKLLPNDMVPGECNPPPPPPPPDPPPQTHVKQVVNDAALGGHRLPHPPPICDTAQTPEDDPIGIHSDKHNEEHEEHALAFVVTNGSKEAAATPPHPPPPNSVLQTLLAALPIRCDDKHNNTVSVHERVPTNPLIREPPEPLMNTRP
jgi:hypothetical protein